jgi:hypothetical protein
MHIILLLILSVWITTREITMAQVAFDTLQYVEKLRSVGFSEPQAKTMSEVQKEVILEVIETQVAKKADVIAVQTDLKSEIVAVKTELKLDIADVRAEIVAVKAELKSDIADVRAEVAALKAELKADIAALNNRITYLEVLFNGKFTLLYWMFGFSLAINSAIFSKLMFH